MFSKAELSQSGRASRPAAAVVLVLALAGCATTDNPDPWEPVNRAVFTFNDKADQYVLEPVAKGYRAAVPEPVRTSIGNVLYNLREPVHAVNSAFQGEREAFGTSLGRFIINTTMGVGGLFDAASTFGYQKVETDFGTTLQKWGVDQGPYVVLPLWGPNTVRGVVGFIPDAFMNPVFYAQGDWPWIAQNSAEAIDWRSKNIENVDDLRGGSIDPYTTVRSIFLQRLVAGNKSTAASDNSSYDSIFQEDDDAP